MRHRISGKQLCLDSDHRKAVLRNLAAGLFEHGQIRTTMPRAKAVQPLVEKIITIAKRGGLTARRQIASKLNDRKVHVWVADPNVKDWKKANAFFDLPAQDEIEFNRYGETRKAPRLVNHIIKNVAPMFSDRAGGYTRIVKLGKHQLGDAADLVLLQLVGREEGPEIGGNQSTRRRTADKRTAFAAKIRKGAKAEAAAEKSDSTEKSE
ncbi:MAG TPA: 50S ribosomal protein L17 [Phycisphaerales bacterium]|nr:50S ribosomal protein L17 [Phycisphaerales bacterium]